MSDNTAEKFSKSSRSQQDYGDDSWVPKIKRRRRFTSDETKILEGEYDKNSSPDQNKIQTIANIIDTPRKIVTTWFQNRRAKNKRKEKTKREENKKRNKNRAKNIMRDDDNYIEDNDDFENETSFEIDDEDDTQDGIYHDNNSSNSSQPNYYVLTQLEVPEENEVFDLSFDTSTILPPQIDSTHQHINRNHPDLNPNTTLSPYYGIHQTNQQLNINIYNNMNNYFYPNNNEQYEESLNRGTRNIYNLSHQSQLLNFLYYQQQQQQQQFYNEATFFTNTGSNRNTMTPLYINSVPSTPADGMYSEFYINPLELCLNYHAPQRHQTSEQQQADYN